MYICLLYTSDNYNCKYENYRGYHKRRMKKPSTAVYTGLKQTEHTQCIHDERIMECDRYERKRGKMKTLHYKQVTYTIKTNAVSYTHLDVYKRQEHQCHN